MGEEFCLSNKIYRIEDTAEWFHIRKFIKLIKESLSSGTFGQYRIHRVIDKLAGEKLT